MNVDIPRVSLNPSGVVGHSERPPMRRAINNRI